MTQKEFEERTGKSVLAETYDVIEKMYMNTELDKDEFCKLYMKAPGALAEIEKQTVLARKLFEEKKCMADFLIAQAEKWSASYLREKAIIMIGEREYLRRKIERKFNLWEADKVLLVELLKA